MHSISFDGGHVSSLLVVFVGFHVLYLYYRFACVDVHVHFWVVNVRLVICNGGLIYLASLDWMWIRLFLYARRVCCERDVL